MRKGEIEVIVSRELYNLLGHKIEVHITVKGAPEPEKAQDGGDMLSFMQQIIDEKNADKKFRTAETYRTTLQRWHDFIGISQPTIGWERITPQLMEAFAEYLQNRGVTKNTQSFYFRILRAVCNRAIREGILLPDGLFKEVYTGKAKTRKRAVALDDIRKIATARPDNESERLARDLFVFSFITRGMALIDIAHLKHANIVGDKLAYIRHKSGQPVSMEWMPEMRRIVDRYADPHRAFLFPLIKTDNAEGWEEYKRSSQTINYHLHKLGKRLDFPVTLTLYVARHSWATIAKSSGVPTAWISDAMGHSSEKMTQIYLDSIDAGRIDKANRDIISQLFR